MTKAQTQREPEANDMQILCDFYYLNLTSGRQSPRQIQLILDEALFAGHLQSRFAALKRLCDYRLRFTRETISHIQATPKGAWTMKQTQFPPGWNETRIQDVIQYYENQTEDEAVAEAEAALASGEQILMAIPKELAPAVRELIARHDATVNPLLLQP